MRILFLIIFSIGCIYANVGIVVDSVGVSTLIRGGEFLKVAQKTKVRVHDTIFTKKGAKVKIFFKDNTVVSLGEKTTFEVDSYFYENNNKKSNIKFKVLRGFFKTVTGEISKVAPQRFKLETKNATIGIRGTVFAAQVGDKVDVAICTDGTIVITTDTGSYELSKGGVAKVSKNSIPTISKYTQKQKREIIRKSGWHGSMTQSELIEFIKKNFKEPLRSQLLDTVQNIFKKDSSERVGKAPLVINADDISFVDDITINGREFDNLPDNIEFYEEDLQDGKVIVQGLLESEDKTVDVKSLHVEITTDGGDTWSRAKGSSEWQWSFAPELERAYEFSLRVVKDKGSSIAAAQTSGASGTIDLISPVDLLALDSLANNINFSWSYNKNAKYNLVISSINGENKSVYTSRGKQLTKNLIDIADLPGNSFKWHVEAYDRQNNILATSASRTIYFPSLSMNVSLQYKDENITKNTDIINSTYIDISNSTTANLSGFVKNSSNDTSVVNVDVLLDNHIISTKQLTIARNSNGHFNFKLLSKLGEGDNHLILKVSKNIQTNSSAKQLERTFIVSKTSNKGYKIGNFHLYTNVTPASDGKISGEGTIAVGILKKFSNYDKKLHVSFQNLSIDHAKVTNGTITYTPIPSKVMTYEPSKAKITANHIIFEPSDAYIKGTVHIKKIGKYIAPTDIDAPHISLQADNFKFESDITWNNNPQKIPIYDGTFAFSLLLKSLHISIDSTRSWYKIIKLSGISGGIEFGNIFSGTNTSISIDANGVISWALNDGAEAKINNSKYFSFINCKGKINVVNDETPSSVSLSGAIRVYPSSNRSNYFDIGTGAEGLTIDSTGIAGSINYKSSEENTKNSKIAGLPVSIKSISLEFAEYDVTAGSLEVGVHYDDFFNSGKEFNFDVSADISSDGINNYGLSTNEDGISFEIDNFASFNFNNLTLESKNRTLHFMTDLTVSTDKTSPIGAKDFVFDKLILDKDGVNLGGVELWEDIEEGSVSASVYGVEVYIEKIGIGIVQKNLFIGFEGGGSIGGDIVSVDDMKVGYYANNRSLKLLNTPNVAIDSSVISFTGGLLVTKDKNGNKSVEADGDLQVKNLGGGIHINGTFMCGKSGSKKDKFNYWRVAADASTSTPIPLTPVPLNLYGFGGGVGHNVSYDVDSKKWTPTNDSDAITFTTVFGTSDGGYTLHGPASLSFSTGGQITFSSTMYVTSGLMQEPKDRTIQADAQLTISPFRFYATGDANISKKASTDYKILELNGQVSMLFSSSNAYVYIGKKETPITANFLEIAQNTGYLMIDSKGLAFGYAIEFKKSGSCCLMYGSIDVGARLDMMIGVKPFYIDAEGKIWAIVSAGVKYNDFKYEVFSAGADIAARFRAPNPTFGKLDVELYYSILGGLVSGKYDMTYWINKPSEGELANEVTTVNNLNVFQYILPAKNEKEVSRFPKIEIATTLPINKSILLDSLLDSPTGKKYKFVMQNMLAPNNGEITSSNIVLADNPDEYVELHDLNVSRSQSVQLIGGQDGTYATKIALYPETALIPGHTYSMNLAGLIIETDNHELVGGRVQQQRFTVTKDEKIGFRSIVEEVHPRQGSKGVYKQSDLYLRVRGQYDDSITVALYDQFDKKVGSDWELERNGMDHSAAKNIYAYVDKNHPDLKPKVVYICNETGEQKNAIYSSDGREHNPFTYYIGENQTTESHDGTSTQKTKATDILGVLGSNEQEVGGSNAHVAGGVDTSNAQIIGVIKKKPKFQEVRGSNLSILYTYTRKVLTTYSIKAVKSKINAQTGENYNTTLFASTFDVFVPHPVDTKDKAGNVHQSTPDYNSVFDMLQATMHDQKFTIVRAPIDYHKMQEDWQTEVIDSYNYQIDKCYDIIKDALINDGIFGVSDSLLGDNAEYFANYVGVEDDYTACATRVNNNMSLHKTEIANKYNKGELSYLLFDFRYNGYVDPSNINLIIMPSCRITSDDGELMPNFNPNRQGFSNNGTLGYEVLSAEHQHMQVKLNLNLYPDINSKLARSVSRAKLGSAINVPSCGTVVINPRKLTDTGDSTSSVETDAANPHREIYKINIPISE